MLGAGSDNDKGLVENAEALDGFQSNTPKTEPVSSFRDPDPPRYMSQEEGNAFKPDSGDGHDFDSSLVTINPFESTFSTVFCIGAFSAIMTIAASVNCQGKENCTGENGYAVAAGVISLLVTIAYLFQLKSTIEGAPENLNLYYAATMWGWWFFGALVLTMGAPFSEPSNGYFACWGAFVSATTLMHEEAASFRAVLGYALNAYERSRHLSLVLFASIVEIIAASSVCVNATCSGNHVFGIVVGCVSLLACVILYVLYERIGRMVSYVVGGLCMWWLLAIIVCTFNGPFTASDGAITNANGFFATWGAFVASIMLLSSGL